MKVTGSNILINDSVVNKMDILPLGNAEQDGTPTPDNPIDVKVVTGDNQVVIANENLLDLSNITEGYLIGRFDGELAQNVSYGASDFIPVKANQSYCQNNTNTWYGAFYDVNKTYVEEVQNQVVITPSVDGYVRVSFLLTNTNSVSVNKGSTSITYVEGKSQSYTLHLGSTELCKIGDYQDYITGSKDNWKVVRNVGKITFVGTENWQRSTNYTNTTTYYLEHGLSNIVADPFLSNYFTFMLGNDDIPHIRWGGTGNSRFLIFSPILNDIDSFKSWLSTHNTTVYYELATPTEEAITDTSLVQSLNELQDMLSYDKVTNITVTSGSDNAQMEVEVTYTSESDMNEKLTNIFNSIKSKLYHIIRSL